MQEGEMQESGRMQEPVIIGETPGHQIVRLEAEVKVLREQLVTIAATFARETNGWREQLEAVRAERVGQLYQLIKAESALAAVQGELASREKAFLAWTKEWSDQLEQVKAKAALATEFAQVAAVICDAGERVEWRAHGYSAGDKAASLLDPLVARYDALAQTSGG